MQWCGSVAAAVKISLRRGAILLSCLCSVPWNNTVIDFMIYCVRKTSMCKYRCIIIYCFSDIQCRNAP